MPIHSKTLVAWVASVFFYLLWPHAQACSLPPGVRFETIAVKQVVDGDTIELTDGRRVRFIGVNTPELGKSPEPVASQARQWVQQWLASHAVVRLVVGVEPRDRYGRWLGHIVSSDGDSLEAYLVEKGMAFTLAIPPNLLLADCLFAREVQARKQSLGVWAEPYWQPLVLAGPQTIRAGFQLLRGRITRVDDGGLGKVAWLELGDAIALQVPARYREEFPADLTLWLGREVEVRGWVMPRVLPDYMKKQGFRPYKMVLQSPKLLNL